MSLSQTQSSWRWVVLLSIPLEDRNYRSHTHLTILLVLDNWNSVLTHAQQVHHFWATSTDPSFFQIHWIALEYEFYRQQHHFLWMSNLDLHYKLRISSTFKIVDKILFLCVLQLWGERLPQCKCCSSEEKDTLTVGSQRITQRHTAHTNTDLLRKKQERGCLRLGKKHRELSRRQALHRVSCFLGWKFPRWWGVCRILSQSQGLVGFWSQRLVGFYFFIFCWLFYLVTF